MKGIMPIVIGATAAMLAPIGDGQSRVPVPAAAYSAADTDALAPEGCAVTFRAGNGAADRATGCEEQLWSAALSTGEERL